MSFVGRSVTRLEDRPLVTGRGAFAADIAFPHMLHMRVVRSGHAHGRIMSIDASAALAMAGVVAVWTSADVSEIPPIDFRLTRIEGLAPYRQPILARQRVRYVGEPVAAVFAIDPYVAEDAADLVAVAVEELPVILDAAAPPGEFEDGRSTEPAVVEKSYGDLAAAFRDAAVVVELDLAVGRHSGVPLESRQHRAHASSQPRERALVRRPCRRRLRNPRRALSRGRAGLPRRAAARSPGEMDRGPPRAPDRGQSFAPAASQGPRRGRCRGPRSRHRRRILPRPGRLCAHPRGHGSRSRGGDAAGSLSRAGVSGGRAR